MSEREVREVEYLPFPGFSGRLVPEPYQPAGSALVAADGSVMYVSPADLKDRRIGAFSPVYTTRFERELEVDN